MNFNKILGYLLIFIGLAIIGWSLYSSYNIFTGKVASPEIFSLPEKELKTTTSDIQVQLEKMLSEQLKGIIPIDVLPKTLNLVVWSMLAGILIFGGSQIASLGIKLLLGDSPRMGTVPKEK